MRIYALDEGETMTINEQTIEQIAEEIFKAMKSGKSKEEAKKLWQEGTAFMRSLKEEIV